jgi:hypothetical protein
MSEVETHAYVPPKKSSFDAAQESAHLEQEKGAEFRKVMEYEEDNLSMSEEEYKYHKSQVDYIKQQQHELSLATPALGEIDSVGGAVDFTKSIVGDMVGTYQSYGKNIGDVYQNTVHAMIADIPEDERTPDAIEHAKSMAAVYLGMDVPLPITGLIGGVAKGVGKSIVKGAAKDMTEDFVTNAVQAAASESGRNREVTLKDTALAGGMGIVASTAMRVPAKGLGEAKKYIFKAATDPDTPTAKVVEAVQNAVDGVYGRRGQKQERIFRNEDNLEGVKFHRDIRENMDITRKVELGKGEELKKISKSLFKKKDNKDMMDYVSGRPTNRNFTPEQRANLDEWKVMIAEEHVRATKAGHGKWQEKGVPQWNKDGTPKLYKRGVRKGEQKTGSGRVLQKVEGYIPITPDSKILEARFDEAVADLISEGKYDAESAPSIIKGYMNADKAGFVPDTRGVVKQLQSGILPKSVEGRPRGNSNLDQSRVIDASQEWQTKYSSKLLIDSLSEWNKRRAHTVALDTYVGVDGAVLATSMGKVAKAQTGAGKTPLDPRWFSDMAQAVDLYDRGVGASLTPGNRTLLSYAKSAANFAYLPLTALSSMTETFNLATKVGALPWLMAQTKMVGSIGQNMMGHAFKDVPKPELHKQLALAGRAWDTSTDQLASRLGETGGLTKGMEYVNDKFFKLTLQSPINYMNNVAAVHAMNAQLKNDINMLDSRNPKRKKAAEERLTDLGIDINDADMVSGFKTRSGAAYQSNMPKVINRFTRDIVLNPTAFDKPAWSSTGWMSMFSQLQGYPMMWASQVFPRMMAQASGKDKDMGQNIKDKANLAMTVSAMVLISYLQESMKAEIRGQDKDEDELAFLAITRAVLPYQVGNMMNAIMGQNGGLQGMLFGTPAVNIMDDITANLRHLQEGNLSPDNAILLKQFKGVY